MTDEPTDEAGPEIHPDFEVEHRPDADPDEILPVRQALARVMGSIQVIRKDQTFDSRRQGQSGGTTYKFRGVDDVVNAVGPMLRRHGVLVMPEALEIQTNEISTSGGGKRLHVIVKMGYRLMGLGGDDEVLIGSAYGESADSGDKGVPKAESVAYRVFWLQALCIPTDDVDPDSENFERGDDQAQQQQSGSGRRSSSSGSRARPKASSSPAPSDAVSESQAEQIRKAIAKLPEGEVRDEALAAFRAEFKVGKASEVKRSDFTKAMRFLHEQLVGPAAAAATDPPDGDDPPDDDAGDDGGGDAGDGPTFSDVHEQLVALMESEKIDRRFVQTTLAKLGLPATGTTDELLNGLAAAWARMGGIPEGAIS